MEFRLRTSMQCLTLVVIAFSTGARAGDYVLVENALGLFHFYRAEPEELTLHWSGKDGTPLRTFDAVQAHLRSAGREATFMMNAGIFEPGGIPSGLHVEGGNQLRPLNQQEGKGNFFLKPNGVFLVDKSGARVLPTDLYAKSSFSPRLALQSGPMLLINGEPHPAFRAASESRLHRNGVGILADGRVLFIVTDLPSGTRVNLFQFAMLFRKHGCQNALFLDGDLSVLAVARDGKLSPIDSKDVESRELVPGVRTGDRFGAILAVTVPLRSE